MLRIKKNWGPGLAIIGFSLLLLLPQLYHQATILGSDSIFHFNRFYDTAMQLKTGQFHYLISLFGYQQSGRIVNALYGPIFAYLQGGLLLLAGNWFRYQLLSRFLLALIAGFGFLKLCRVSQVKDRLALPLSLLFLTTFAVQYWSSRQGFSSWGVAFFPWCLIPAIRVVETKTIKPINLALAVAIMLQVHSLSTLFLVLSYLPFFLYALIKTAKPWTFIGQGLTAVGLSLLLTANVWFPLLSLGQANDLIQPFINKNLPYYTIDRGSSKLFWQPWGLGFLMMVQAGLACYRRKQNQPVNHLISLVALIFLWLSSSFFPWDSLAGQGIKAIELIQFPFRFFLLATPLALLALGTSLGRLNKWPKGLTILLWGLTLWGLGQTLHQQDLLIHKQYLGDQPIQERKHTYFLGTADQIRQAIHSDQPDDLLKLVVKSTPDYLPLYQATRANKYKLYKALVIDQADQVTKTVQGQQLVVNWTSANPDPITLPLVVYAGSQVSLNGQKLTLADLLLTPIGTPIVTSQVGNNQLILSYPHNKGLLVALLVSLISWLGLGSWAILQKLQKA